MTMSVMWVPLARMAEKAACPGVSRKVIFSPEGKCTVNKWIPYILKAEFHIVLFDLLQIKHHSFKNFFYNNDIF